MAVPVQQRNDEAMRWVVAGRRVGSGGLAGNRIARQETDWAWKPSGAAGQRWSQFLGRFNRTPFSLGMECVPCS